MPRVTSKRAMRLDRWLQERLETLAGKVALLVGVVLALVFGGAAIVHFALGHFRTYTAAAWWAFLHVMDPAALRDDRASDIRLVGAILVLAGLIVLVGILFEILTQVVDSSLERLSESDVPVEARGHLLVAGWNDRLPDSLGFLIEMAPKLRTDLRRVFSTIIVLAPIEARPQRAAMLADLRRATHGTWHDPQIVFGDLDRPPSYALGSAQDARAIVVGFTMLSGHVPDPMMLDAANVRTALALANFLDSDHDGAPGGRPAPYVGIALYWGEHADTALPTLPAGFDGLVIDRSITSLVALELTHPAWSEAIHRLLMHADGARIQFVRDPTLTGFAFADLPDRFGQAAPIGVHSASGTVRLAPPPETTIGPDDAVIVLAERDVTLRPAGSGDGTPSLAPLGITACGVPLDRTVLIVGFNHRVLALLAELASIPFARFHVVSLSHIAAQERQRTVPPSIASRLTLDYIEGVPTEIEVLRDAIARRPPAAVIVSGDWNQDGMERMEAEILFSFLALKRLVDDRMPVLVMPYTGDYADIFSRGITDRGLMSAHRLSAVGLVWNLLQPQVIPVFNALIGTHETRLTSLTLPDGPAATFAALASQLARQGAALAGIVQPDGMPRLAPPADTPLPPGTELLLILPAGAGPETARAAAPERAATVLTTKAGSAQPADVSVAR